MCSWATPAKFLSLSEKTPLWEETAIRDLEAASVLYSSWAVWSRLSESLSCSPTLGQKVFQGVGRVLLRSFRGWSLLNSQVSGDLPTEAAGSDLASPFTPSDFPPDLHLPSIPLHSLRSPFRIRFVTLRSNEICLRYYSNVFCYFLPDQFC